MKIKSMLFPLATIAFVAVVGFYIGGSRPDTKSEAQPVSAAVKKSDYSAKVREVEADFAQRRQKIENDYANMLQQRQTQSNGNPGNPNAAGKTGRPRSVKQTTNPEFESYGSTRSNGRASAGDTAFAGESHRTATTRVEGDPSSDFWQKATEGSAASEAIDTDKLSEAVKSANDEAPEDNLDEHYQRQKECALNDLEKERQLALTAVYNQQNHDTAAAIASDVCGVVMGILSSEGVPMTIIDGNVTKEGQIINGVKVVKINPDCVEFRYAKKQWTQKVNETPSTNWP